MRWLLLFLLGMSPQHPENGAPAWPPSSDLPNGILATVNGTSISTEDFCRRLARERQDTPPAAAHLGQFLDTRLITQAMGERGVDVTAEDLARKYESLAARMEMESGGTQKLESLLADRGITKASFKNSLRFLIGLEKLARLDFGIDPEDTVPDAKMNLWLTQLRETSDIQLTDLPEGIVARTEKFSITEVELGESLAELEDPAELRRLLRTLISETLIRKKLETENLEVRQEDLVSELAFRRWAFARLEKYAGVTYDQYLEATRSLTPEQVMATEDFYHQVALKRITRKLHPIEDRRAYYGEHSDRYGPLVRVRHLFLSTRSRTVEEALELMAEIRSAVNEGARFGEIIEKRSESSDRLNQGDTGYFSATDTKLAPEFLDAAFRLEPGKISEPIRTPDGIHLLQVTGTKPLPPFEEADDLVIRDLSEAWFRQQLKNAVVLPSGLYGKKDSQEEG